MRRFKRKGEQKKKTRRQRDRKESSLCWPWMGKAKCLSKPLNSKVCVMKLELSS